MNSILRALRSLPARTAPVKGGLILLLFLCAGFTARADLDGILTELGMTGYPPDWTPPPFRTERADGGEVTLAQYRGRVVLINFWATWCVPCLTEMPAIEALHRTYSGRGLTVLGVNVEEKAPLIRRFGRRTGVTFPLLLDPQGAIHKAYGVIALPTTFLLARDGRPVALAIGVPDWKGEKMQELIELLLAEPSARQGPE